jgi:protein tolA
MASTYTMVAYGSQGSTVRQLQNELNKRGYGLAEDGIFGKKTRSAVRDYQKKNGLTMVDGIAGDETWGSLLSAAAVQEPQLTPTAQGTFVTAAESTPRAEVTAGTAWRLRELEQGYTPSDEVTAARAYRDSVAAMEPGAYQSRFEEKLQELYDQIAGREAFDYDPEEDEAYRRYAKLYAARGAAAMEDTLGKAASLTGGYGSSYAQSAGQQAYNGYLQELAALVPELRQAALAEYRQEGQALADQYSMLSQREKNDYARYQNERADWQKLLAAAQDEYESADSGDRKLYQTLLNHFSDKAEQERKLSASGARLTDSGDGTSGGESLSSTAADSLQRAVQNYLKRGNGDLAQSLASRYTARMTPAQRQRFERLFSGYGMTLA